jgi:hypothetical protein
VDDDTVIAKEMAIRMHVMISKVWSVCVCSPTFCILKNTLSEKHAIKREDDEIKNECLEVLTKSVTATPADIFGLGDLLLR